MISTDNLLSFYRPSQRFITISLEQRGNTRSFFERLGDSMLLKDISPHWLAEKTALVHIKRGQTTQPKVVSTNIFQYLLSLDLFPKGN